jgi:flagellar L-ring protein FlgH
MMKSNMHQASVVSIIVFCICALAYRDASAQETSLFRQAPAMAYPSQNANAQASISAGTLSPPVVFAPPAGGATPAGAASPIGMDGAVGLNHASWTYTPAPPLRTFRVQDIVTIRVDELARMQANGLIDSRRNGLYNAVLKEWVALRDGDLGKDLQKTGDPAVDGQTNQLYRANSAIQSRESLAFSVAAKVVDIQPNGNLVLEARKTIWLNDNIWETSLTGVCRAQDIAPDNIILSRDLLDLEIHKNETGEVRDGYKRGWLTRWINEFNPF